MSASRCVVLSVLLAILSFSPPALAQADQGFVEAETGRDLRHFARDRVADVKRVQLDVAIADMSELRVEVIERITFEPLGRPLESWTLDAVDLDVRAVMLAGASVPYLMDEASLTMRFERPIPAGRERELTIRYFLDRPLRGLSTRPATEARLGEIHTDSNLQGARHWFAVMDDPRERFAFDVTVDVPKGYSVISNGHRVDVRERGERTIFRWRQDQPITADQVVLSIGAFETMSGAWQSLPLYCNVDPGTSASATALFEAIGEMLTFYEAVTGARYPWDGLTIVATDLVEADVRSGAGVIQVHGPLLAEWLEAGAGMDPRLLAEAVARQWAGALLTCADWSEIWIVRGLAKYLSCMWIESAWGEGDFAAEMLALQAELLERFDPTNRLGMVHRYWRDPNTLLDHSLHPTARGAWIFHMLRHRLGDAEFRLALRDLFSARHEHGIDTELLRRVMQARTGLALDRLFEYYVRGSSLPRLHVKVGWSDDASELLLDATQPTASGDPRDLTPAYRIDVPIVLQFEDRREERLIRFDERYVAVRLPLPTLPRVVAIDPERTQLVMYEEDQAAMLWRNQLISGPTAYSRALAAESLGENADYHIIDLLAQVASNSDEAAVVRRAAIRGLGAAQTRQARRHLVHLAEQMFDFAELRLELLRQIGLTPEPEAGELLALHAAADPVPAVAAEAIGFLRMREAFEYADLLRQILVDDAAAARVRRAALSALWAFDDGPSWRHALDLAQPGAADTRTRAVAIQAAASLGYRDPDATFAMLVDRLHEPIPLMQAAALVGLANWGEARALQEVRSFAESTRDPNLRALARESLDILEEQIGTAETEAGKRIRFLQERVRELEAEVERLRSGENESRGE